jgi:hypothetical protein
MAKLKNECGGRASGMKEGGGRKHSAREGIKSKNGYNTVFL